ncbi:MAG: NAD-dependent epimerase/dehydratase family protein [Chloroflexi bacterium]|nr:NAD-dependent epimerase/dehydratase family protein [Chloroflexota bacterium]
MNLRGKRIVVTGSDGFVGSHLVPRLRQEEAEVIPVDISKGTDVANWEQVKHYKDIDIIYHLAAKTCVPATVEDPRETYLINFVGTLNMLELGRRSKIKNFVFASSYVYGHPEYIPIDECHPIKPNNPYSRSKAISEDICRAYNQDYGLRCIILRAFNVYGERQRDSFLIPSILKQIHNEEIELEDPEPRRDFFYVKDLVEAYVRAAEYSGSDFEILNIGSGVSYSVDEIVKTILNLSGKRARVRYRRKRRENEVMNTVADITKAKKTLGWVPTTPLNQGLKTYIKWHQDKASEKQAKKMSTL